MPGLGFNQSHSGREGLNRLLSAISIKRMTTQPWFVQHCTLANGRQFRKVSFWQPPILNLMLKIRCTEQFVSNSWLVNFWKFSIIIGSWAKHRALFWENCSLKPRYPLVCNFKRCKTEIKTYKTRTAIPCQENHNCKSRDTNRKQQKVVRFHCLL